MNYKLKNMILVSLFTSIICILSILTIPLPTGVPLTLQTFVIATCGYTLGTNLGVLCVLLYILIGVIGVPVFSGMTSGIAHLLGLTGGFITGFIFLVSFTGYSKKFKNKLIIFSLSLLGLVLCHILGIIQYSLVSKNNILTSFLTVSLPFLIKDIISVILGKLFSLKLSKFILKQPL